MTNPNAAVAWPHVFTNSGLRGKPSGPADAGEEK
jgi:hypothetical protein